MRIAYVGNWITQGLFCSDELKYARALERAGHQVRQLYLAAGPPAGADADLVLWTKISGGIRTDQLEAWKKAMPCPHAMWHWDACWKRPAFEWFWKCVPLFDVIFHNEEGLFDQYEETHKTPWRYLRSACDLEYHSEHGLPDLDWLCDIGFIGTPYGQGQRQEVMQALAAKFKTHAWGTDSRWDQLGIAYKGTAYGEEIAHACASTKIMIGCSAKNWCEGSWSNRVDTVLGSSNEYGAMFLTEDVPGLADQYLPGEHLDVYRTPEEAVEKAAYWLARDAERTRVALEGAAHERTHHTWDVRASQMMAHLEELGLVQ